MKKILSFTFIATVCLYACNKHKDISLSNQSKLESSVKPQSATQDNIQVEKLKKFLSVLLSSSVDSIHYNEQDQIFSNKDKSYKVSYDEINSIYKSANEYKAKYETEK